MKSRLGNFLTLVFLTLVLKILEVSGAHRGTNLKGGLARRHADREPRRPRHPLANPIPIGTGCACQLKIFKVSDAHRGTTLELAANSPTFRVTALKFRVAAGGASILLDLV